MIHDAISIGGKAFDGNLNLHVSLRTFEEIAELVGEDIDGRIIIRTGDTNVIDPLYPRGRCRVELQWLRKTRPDASGGLHGQFETFRPAQSRDRFTVTERYVSRSHEVRRRGHIFDT